MVEIWVLALLLAGVQFNAWWDLDDKDQEIQVVEQKLEEREEQITELRQITGGLYISEMRCRHNYMELYVQCTDGISEEEQNETNDSLNPEVGSN